MRSCWNGISRTFRSFTYMVAPTRPRPVVAVIGTTGVGKSQLAVSLAQSLASSSSSSLSSSPGADTLAIPRSGVILSADSMQLYKGLDVITNKVTEEEKGGVEHWGLDIVQMGQGGSWEMGKWCSEADKRVRNALCWFMIETRPNARSARCPTTPCRLSAEGLITSFSISCSLPRSSHLIDGQRRR